MRGNWIHLAAAAGVSLSGTAAFGHIAFELDGDSRIVTFQGEGRGDHDWDVKHYMNVFHRPAESGDPTFWDWGTNSVLNVFDEGSEVGFNFRAPLWKWDDQESTFDELDFTSDETVSMGYGPQTVTSADGFVDGLPSPLHDSDPGRHHRHYDFILNPADGAAEPGDGVYVIELEAFSTGPELTSEPFWMFFDYNPGDGELDRAMAAIPEPGSLALLGIGGAAMLLRGRRQR